MKKAKEDTWRERIFEELVSCYPDDMENFSTMTHSQAYRVLICFWKKIPKINLNQNKMKELENIKKLFEDFCKKADKFVEKRTEQEKVIQAIPAKTIEWGETSEKEMTWQEAKDWCKEQGGRLPTQIELLQAYEGRVTFPKDSFWSSTESYYNSSNACTVYLNLGYTLNSDKTLSSYYARCVRSVNKS